MGNLTHWLTPLREKNIKKNIKFSLNGHGYQSVSLSAPCLVKSSQIYQSLAGLTLPGLAKFRQGTPDFLLCLFIAPSLATLNKQMLSS